ncbi:hypothetical protein Lal_00017100 [Lupinus albus]|nr:hypothetical protein Lal_00017100 [Lupinus albus]
MTNGSTHGRAWQTVGLGQPDFQREVGLGQPNIMTHGSRGSGSQFGPTKLPKGSRFGPPKLHDTWQWQTIQGHLAHAGFQCCALYPTFKYVVILSTYLSSLFMKSEPSKDVIRMRHVNMFDEEPLLNDILQLTGFSKLSSLRSFNIDPCLITALVERWRLETHTFHLPHGECTITLEDVSLQIGVNVNGLPLAGPTYFDWNEICEELLGKVPSDEQDMRACELKLTWLFDNFETLPLALHNCKKSNFVGHESYT